MKIKNLKYEKPNDKFVLGGIDYDLSHLKSEIITLNNVKVYVQYTTHTWTQGRQTTDNPSLFVEFGNKCSSDKRTFELGRYESSKQLKGIICNLKPNDKFFKSTKDWFFIKDGFYHIFMNIKPAKNPRYDYIIFITSAHHRDSIERGIPKALKHVLNDKKHS